MFRNKDAFRALKSAIFLSGFLAHSGCGSAKYVVSDENYFTDGYAFREDSIQFVESVDDPTLTSPAAARFKSNCGIALQKATDRFRSKYPQATDSGKLLSERFDKNAGCTVRVAFRIR